MKYVNTDVQPAETEYFEERAAIREFDGGDSRADAETRAYAEMVLYASGHLAVQPQYVAQSSK